MLATADAASHPLHAAVERLWVDDVRDVFQMSNVEVDAKDGRGRTAFELAFHADDLEIVRALVESGADPNQLVWLPGYARMPAVHAACVDGNERLLRLLLRFATADVKWWKHTPIFVATVLNRVSV
jgi:ankyrin repeat protein